MVPRVVIVARCYRCMFNTILTMELIRAAEFAGFRTTMDSSEDEGLFITQSSTKADISAEIESNVV